jgi:hypothetical protein
LVLISLQIFKIAQCFIVFSLPNLSWLFAAHI